MSRSKRHAIALALAAGVLAIPGAASAGAATFTVNDNATGSGPSGANCAAAGFTSIQSAVNAAAPGDTILVCAGRYTDPLNVNKDLTLNGAQAGVDARSRSGAIAGESVISGADNDFDGVPDPNTGGVGLNANGITFDGFSVVDSANAATGSGIAMSPSFGNYLVQNNIVADNSIGIGANNAGGSPSTITHNLISDNNEAGSAAGNGIYADANVDDLTITENEFNRHRNAAILLTCVCATPANANNEISNNQFTSSPNPFKNENRVLLIGTEDTVVRGNTFTSPANNAIQLSGANDSIAIRRNTITGSGFAAVRLRGDFGTNPGTIVIGNTLINGDSAIRVNSSGLANGEALTARGNRIAGNTLGIENESPGDVFADDNFFGCNSGPNTSGCDTTSNTGTGLIDATEFLRLIVRVPAQIPDGETRRIRAQIVGGEPCEFPRGTPIQFSTTAGVLQTTTAFTQGGCRAKNRLTAVGTGSATVTATLDNAVATDTTDFIP